MSQEGGPAVTVAASLTMKKELTDRSKLGNRYLVHVVKNEDSSTCTARQFQLIIKDPCMDGIITFEHELKRVSNQKYLEDDFTASQPIIVYPWVEQSISYETSQTVQQAFMYRLNDVNLFS